MNIYIDENIPFATEFFADYGNLHFFSGRSLSATDVKNADVLLVRSITKVNEQLLHLNTRIKFVGTATIGMDHIDQDYLEQRGITFSSAPGCNKVSVAEYVLSSLLVLSEKQQFELKNKSVAIVGAGNTGSAVFQRLNALGMNCKLYDPPLLLTGDDRDFCSFKEVLKADVISLHVPKVVQGEFPTVHLFDQGVLSKLTKNQILINASRGDVIDNDALLELCQTRKMPTLVLDVWENEPNTNTKLLPFVEIATPHIAGYSLEGKTRGTEILYQQFCQLFSLQVVHGINSFLPVPAIEKVNISSELDQTLLKSLIHLIYDVRRDDILFRTGIDQENGFDMMRKNYKERRELSSLLIQSKKPQQPILTELGFTVSTENTQ